jgi:predicted Na+-dependent transporter
MWKRIIQFSAATTINICNGISVQNLGMGIAIAKNNNDTSMIDPILIEYYKVIQLYFFIKLNVNIKISCSLTLCLNNWVNAFMNIKILEAD